MRFRQPYEKENKVLLHKMTKRTRTKQKVQSPPVTLGILIQKDPNFVYFDKALAKQLKIKQIL
jgi:hypothetical protein